MKTKNLIILASLLVAGITSFCWASVTPTGSDKKNILLNIFSSVTVVFLIELIVFFRDWLRFSFLKGPYKRSKIFYEDETKKSASKYVDITETYTNNNVNSEINLVYSGDGKYHGHAFYDKGEKGKTEITLQLDLENSMQGKGTYQYFDKTVIDLGNYIFQVDINKKNHLYFLFKFAS